MKLLAAVLLFVALFVSHAAGLRAAEPSIRGVSASPMVRVLAPDAPPGKTWLYQVALPFQVSSTQGAIFANVREALAQGVDFEVGNDVIVFGRFEEIASSPPVVVNRNHNETNPKSNPANRPCTMVQYPIRGGFVPLGAKRADGSPHPHAGTGFGFNLAQAWKTLVSGPPPYLQNSYSGDEAFSYLEFHQFAFDGEVFLVTETQRVSFDGALPGCSITNGGMTNAIADGDDLLVAMVGKTKLESPSGTHFNGSGMLRMSRRDGKWQAVTFRPVPGLANTIEPSLVRDVDGSLLVTARGSSNASEGRNGFRVFKSQDGGTSWVDVIRAGGIIAPGPMTLNQAADGTPYLAANLQSVMPGPRDPLTLTAQQRNRPVEPGVNTRSALAIWPISAARDSLSPRITVLDCRAEFGPPVGGGNWTWRADHPSGMTVRLADGNWHHLLGVRVQDYREINEAMPPTPRTGMYLFEVLSSGESRPVWAF